MLLFALHLNFKLEWEYLMLQKYLMVSWPVQEEEKFLLRYNFLLTLLSAFLCHTTLFCYLSSYTLACIYSKNLLQYTVCTQHSKT